MGVFQRMREQRTLAREAEEKAARRQAIIDVLSRGASRNQEDNYLDPAAVEEFKDDEQVFGLVVDKIKKGEQKNLFQLLPKEMQEDKDIYLGYFRNNYTQELAGTYTRDNPYSFDEYEIDRFSRSHILDLPESLRGDKSFILKALDILTNEYRVRGADDYDKQTPSLAEYFYNYVSDELKGDKDISRAIFRAQPTQSNFASAPEQLKDKNFYIEFFRSSIKQFGRYGNKAKSNLFLDGGLDFFFEGVPSEYLKDEKFVKQLIDIDPLAYGVIGRVPKESQEAITRYALDKASPDFYEISGIIPKQFRNAEFLHDYLIEDAKQSRKFKEDGRLGYSYLNSEIYKDVANNDKLFPLYKICSDAQNDKALLEELIKAGGVEMYLLVPKDQQKDVDLILAACEHVKTGSHPTKNSGFYQMIPEEIAKDPAFFIEAASRSDYNFSYWFPKAEQNNVEYLMLSVSRDPKKFIECAAGMEAATRDNIFLLKRLIDHAFDLEETKYFGTTPKKEQEAEPQEHDSEQEATADEDEKEDQ